MAGLFAQAKAKKTETKKPKSKKKATTWVAGDPNGDKVAGAVHEMVELTAQKKAIEAKMGAHKTIVLKFAHQRFFEAFADLGVFPETPMVVQNSDGEKVTYVVQDRSAQYGVKDEQMEALISLLGQDAAENLVAEETTFKFAREPMMRPEVQEILEKHLESAITEMHESGALNEDEDLLDVDVRKAFKPGTLQRIAQICGRDTNRMAQFIDIMGSSAVRYVKA